LNLILQDHARRIQDHETNVGCVHDHFVGAIVLFNGICFCVYKLFDLLSDVT